MRAALVSAVLAAILTAGLAAPVVAKGSSSRTSSSHVTTSRSHPSAPKTHGTTSRTRSTSSKTKAPKTTKTTTHTSTTRSRKSQEAVVGRDSKGRISRSEEAKRTFERQSGYPNGRKGYVIDHIKPLACGGLDVPSNMQWQTVAEARAKDKVERKGCH